VGLAFVGEQRRAAVDELVQAWQSCVIERRSELVLIEGHPGVGKTRLVQEFYERLRVAQEPPAYWPTLLDASGESALQDRGRIRPLQFQCPPGARPRYAWVAVTCRLDELTGLPSRALVDAVGATEHLMERVIRPIGRSRRMVAPLWRAAMVLVGMAVVILGVSGIGGIEVVVPGALVAATGLAFEFREQLQRVSRELSHRRGERTRQDVMIDVAKPLEDVSIGAHARASGFLGALARRAFLRSWSSTTPSGQTRTP
jgi:hypothetical protein